MGQVEPPPAEVGLSVSRFFSLFVFRRENLTAGSKNLRVIKGFQKWQEKVFGDDHVIVEKHDNVMAGLLHSKIVSFPKTQIFSEPYESDMRLVLAHPLRAPVTASVVDYHNFMLPACSLHGTLQSWKAFL